jgi:rfaE bifunctional protein nucleotidyltransferase chain/domain
MNRLDQIKGKIHSYGSIERVCHIWRLQSKTIVFTNGCFDLLHLGHVDYLSKAADLGSELIVGVNSDQSVRNLKGLHRPITDQVSRSVLLASLSFVSAVVVFDAPTPYELITLVNPDVLVKGGDWLPDQIVGNDIVRGKGGVVLSIDLLEGYSTTNIEKRIKCHG